MPGNRRPARRSARFSLRAVFTVLSLGACFTALGLLAYLFRLTITDPEFKLAQFPSRVVRDLGKLDDPNTQMQLKQFFSDLGEDFRGYFSPKRPREL
jgi:hypothetical protein